MPMTEIEAYLFDYIKSTNANQNAVIKMLREYSDFEWRFKTAEKQIKKIDERMKNITSKIDKAKVSGGGTNKAEEKLVESISEKDVIERGYSKAKVMLDYLNSVLDRLTEDERYYIRKNYIENNDGFGIDRIMEERKLGRSQAYNLTSKALDRLVRLIYW